MSKDEYPARVPPANETIPPGLRKCPLKFRKKRRQYYEQFCDKERCAMWNDEKKRCGYIQ